MIYNTQKPQWNNAFIDDQRTLFNRPSPRRVTGTQKRNQGPLCRWNPKLSKDSLVLSLESVRVQVQLLHPLPGIFCILILLNNNNDNNKIWNRVDCRRSERKKSKTHKRLNRTLFNQTKQDRMQIFEGILLFKATNKCLGSHFTQLHLFQSSSDIMLHVACTVDQIFPCNFMTFFARHHFHGWLGDQYHESIDGPWRNNVFIDHRPNPCRPTKEITF